MPEQLGTPAITPVQTQEGYPPLALVPPIPEVPPQHETPPVGEVPPMVEPAPGMVARTLAGGVETAKQATEAAKLKLADPEFRGRLFDRAETAVHIGAAAVKSTRMFDFDPQNGKPRVKPGAAEDARAHPGGTALRVGYHLGKAFANERGRYQELQRNRQS